MARLGISIYPEHSTEEQDIAYMRKAGKLGYKRIFTCLLSIGEKSREEIIGQFCRPIDFFPKENLPAIVRPAVLIADTVIPKQPACVDTKPK